MQENLYVSRKQQPGAYSPIRELITVTERNDQRTYTFYLSAVKTRTLALDSVTESNCEKGKSPASVDVNCYVLGSKSQTTSNKDLYNAIPLEKIELQANFNRIIIFLPLFQEVV